MICRLPAEPHCRECYEALAREGSTLCWRCHDAAGLPAPSVFAVGRARAAGDVRGLGGDLAEAEASLGRRLAGGMGWLARSEIAVMKAALRHLRRELERERRTQVRVLEHRS